MSKIGEIAMKRISGTRSPVKNEMNTYYEMNPTLSLPCKHQVGSWICSVPYATPSINNEDPLLTVPGSLTTTIMICAHNFNLHAILVSDNL